MIMKNSYDFEKVIVLITRCAQWPYGLSLPLY